SGARRRRNAAGDDRRRPSRDPGQLHAPPGGPRSWPCTRVGGLARPDRRGDRAARRIRARRPVASRAALGPGAPGPLPRAGRAGAQMKPPCVLVLAGLDPSGAAGILADAEAVRAGGARPLCVATALTVQTTRTARRFET